MPSFLRCAAPALLVALWGAAAHAADTTGLDLAKAKNCLSCHRVDAKVVGPAYQQVAQKYAADSGAVAMLENSIRKGSSRKWGAVPMPAQSQVSEAEAHQLAEWIMTLKP